MNSFKKLLLSLFVLSLFLVGCKGEPTTLKDVSLETVLPEDSSMVFVIDYSDEDQIDYFEDIKDRFPETDLRKTIVDYYDSELADDELSYEDDIEPIFDGDWKLGFGMVFPEDFNFGETEALPEDFEIVLAMELEEADDLEDLIQLIDPAGGSLDYEEAGEISHWTNESDDVYITRYGDLFFLTNQLEYREDALFRLDEGTGFDSNEGVLEELALIAEKNLGYMYVNGGMLGDLLVDVYSSMGMDDIAQYFGSIGDIYLVWSADADGIMLASKTEMLDDEALLMYGIDPSYELTLIDDVNSEGLIVYAEQGLLGPSMKAFFEGFASGYNSVNDGMKLGSSFSEADTVLMETSVIGVPSIKEESTDYYEQMLNTIAVEGGMTAEEVEDVLNSPFAFAMSDVGAVYPTISLYLKVGEDKAENAKNLIAVLDDYVDQIVEEFDEMMLAANEGEGIFKKDIEIVNGGTLTKIYVDWEASPSMSLNLGLAGLTPEDVNAELYYGLTGDNVFVVALHPDFESDFGKNVLSENEDYQEGVAKLGDSFSYGVSYFSPRPLVDIASRYVDLILVSGFAPNAEEIKESFDLYGVKFVGAFKYFISSGVIDEGEVRSDTYIRIEEVE